MHTYRYLLIYSLIVAAVLTNCNGMAANAALPVPQTGTPTLLPAFTATPTKTVIPTSTQTSTPAFTPTPAWILQGPGKLVCPILLYHHIADSPTDSRYYVSPDKFEAQIKLLKEWGYQTIPLSLLVEAITNGTELPPRPVIITFDDGNIDVYTNAFPIMQQFGFTGVLYIISNYLQADGYISAGQLQEMAAADWEVGSHSMNHDYLTKIRKDRLYAEVVQSRHDLEEALGVPVKSFAYPYGLFNDAAVDYVHFARYESAVGLGYTAEQGPGNLFNLQRREIKGEYDLKTFTLFLPWTETLETSDTATP
jgi:peptidoglycan/xylan/chitin deacetylase (PgdA/CDA1 family)